MENEETPQAAASAEVGAAAEAPAAGGTPPAGPDGQGEAQGFDVWTSSDVDWMDDPTLANGPGLTQEDFNDLPAGAKRVLAKVRAENKQRVAHHESEMNEVRALRAEIDRLKVSRLQELADLQRHVKRESFRALDKPVEVPNVDPSSSEYINAMVAKAVAEKVAEFQNDLQGMTQGAADEVTRLEQKQAAESMQSHTLEQVKGIENKFIRGKFVEQLKSHAARYHGGTFKSRQDLDDAIETAKLKLGLVQRTTDEFIPQSFKDENRAPQNLDEVYGDYAEMSAGQLAQLMVDHPEEADKILKRRKRYLSER